MTDLFPREGASRPLDSPTPSLDHAQAVYARG
ncbi:hypothetical protein SRABI128_01809 [Microbacterium sp. Bi128]|nr:hypothetical protein SRABI128_01809 [Microbacterium sp. Bi128]